MKRVLFLVIALSLVSMARADEQTQAVQQALKDQGFYYGNVDGQPGPETDAAVRRYQIRQGLDVTGKLDEQTLDSLNLGSKSNEKNTLQAVPPPAGESAGAQGENPPPPKSVVQDDHDFLRQQPPGAAAPAPGANDDAAPQPQPQPAPEEAAPPAPEAAAPAQPEYPAYPRENGQTSPAEYARFFRKTPYEIAPAVVQRSTVQRAQMRLAREGFYRGVADGELSDLLSRALVAYQRDGDIRPTGRLDMETLSDMDLLPRRQAVIAPPYYGPDPGREVYRGIWVH